MFYYSRNIKPVDAKKIFAQYQISDEDFNKYTKLIDRGKLDEALDDFLKKYVLSAVNEYEQITSDYVDKGLSGEIDRKNSTILYSSIITLSLLFKSQIKENATKFFSLFAKKIFIDEKITSPDVKKKILDVTLTKFNELVENAMSQTQAAILSPIRDAQRLFIQANQTIVKNKITGKALDTYVKQFKIDIEKKIPGLRQYTERGLLLNNKGKSYSFDYYFEMSTRTTALNVQRYAVEHVAENNQDEILLYYLSDNRPLKTEAREICREVLSKKIKGYSFVALTERASSLLGIPLLSTVRAQGGLGPNCRHNIKRVSLSFQKEILNEAA